MFGKSKIRTKLLISYLVFILLGAAISSLIFQQIQGVTRAIHQKLPLAIEDIRNSSNLDGLSQAIKYYDEVLTQSARNYSFTGKKIWKDRYMQVVPHLDSAIKKAIDLGDEDDKKFFSDVDKANLALVEIEEQALEAVDEGNANRAIGLLESDHYWELKKEYKSGLESYVNRRGKNYEEVLVVTSTSIEALLSSLRLHSAKTSFILSVTLLAALIVSILLTIFMSGKITDPLRQLQKATEDISNSREAGEIVVNSKDEIQDLANSFNRMAKQLGETTVSRDYVDSIIYSMIDTLVVVNSKEKIKTVNQAMCDLLGYKEKELIGQDVSILFTGKEEIPLKGAQLQKLVHEGSIRDYAINYRTKDRKNIPVNFSASVLKDKGGSFLGVVGVARDMREIQRLMEREQQHIAELTRSNKELEEFAYIASHDLQEPLRKIKTFGDRLIQKYEKALGDQGRDYLRRMGSAASRMHILINDLLTYSRVTSKTQPFTPVNLNNIVREVLSDLEIKIEEVNAKINVDELPTLEADPMQMRQLFQNFISNSLKFRKAETPPVVEIRSLLKSPKMKNGDAEASINQCVREIQIVDNGIGFDEKYKERIFSVFQRLHGRTEYEGTGIGLAVCRKIILRHGGNIDVESTPGKGTTFIITLPVVQPKKKTEGDA